MVIIERGATADVELNSDQYRSALVQGGLEIKCKVTVKVPNATSRQVTERYHPRALSWFIHSKHG